MPLNATALALIGRNLMNNMFQTGFHYNIAGYDIYAGEIILAAATLLIFAFLSIRGVKFTGIFQACLVLCISQRCLNRNIICNILGKNKIEQHNSFLCSKCSSFKRYSGSYCGSSVFYFLCRCRMLIYYFAFVPFRLYNFLQVEQG